MKQILRKTFLVLAAGIMSSGAWAGAPVDLGNGTSRLGAEDNSTAWWTDFTEFVEIAPNKTLTYTFVNYSSKANDFNNWAVQILAASNYEYLIMRADCYGITNGDWAANGKNTGSTGDHSWFTCNYDNYDREGTNFKDNLDGATVVMTIKRNGASLILIEDVTTADGTKKFRHYFEMDCPASTDENLKSRLTVDNAHLIINNTVPVVDSAPLKTATGTQIGRSDLATPWWTAFSDYYTIQGGQTAKLHFKNYSNKAKNQNNWVLVVTNNNDRGTTEYKEYFALRSDNFGWNGSMGDYWNTSNLTSNYVWDTYADEMDGADVVMTIARNGDDVTITAKQTAATDGTTVRTETYTFTESSANTFRVFLTVEGGMLDILSDEMGVSTTIGAKEWSTFSDANNKLDFSKADEGLTAYIITGQTDKVITKTAVTTAVPEKTGLLLNGEADKTYFIPLAASAMAPSGNLLKVGDGSDISMVGSHTYYVLTYEDGDAQFKKLTSAVAVPVGKAYLDFSTVIEARSIDIEGDGTTGINMVNGEGLKVNGSGVYDLSGRFIGQWSVVNGQLRPGLYIVNGKKVILK